MGRGSDRPSVRDRVNGGSALDRTALLVQQDVYPSLSFDEIKTALTSVRVRLRVHPHELAVPGVQTLLTTAAIAAAQSGAQLDLAFPEISVAGEQRPLEGDALRESLQATTADMITPALIGSELPADVTLLVGRSQPGRHDGLALRVSADAFGWRVSPPEEAPLSDAGRSPFGPVAAGLAGAAEGFRVALVRMGLLHGVEPLAEHRVAAFRRAEGRLPPLPLGTALNLGRADAISAGAITTATFFVLTRLKGVRGQFRVFDRDVMGESNLNRYPLLVRRDLGRVKPDVLRDQCWGLIEIEPIRQRFDDALANSIGGLRETAIVGVDDIPSRWAAQRATRGWLSVGGTSHFAALVSEHVPGMPCAGCLHPADDPGDADIPTCSFVSGFAGLLQAHRVTAHALGVPVAPPVLAYPFNLGALRPVREIGLVARADCPVGCKLAIAA